MERKLRKDKQVWKYEFSNDEGKKLCYLITESEFQRVGTVCILTLGTDNKWQSDKRSSLGLDDKESMENRYESSPEESVW